MTVESATKIEQLNPLLPTGGDDKSEGDNHLRLIKEVLVTAFAFTLADVVGQFIRVKADGTGFEATALGTAAALNFGTAADNLLKKSSADTLYTAISHLTNYANPHRVKASQLTDFLTYLKTLDGSGSGIDADLLDGVHGSGYWDKTTNPSLVNFYTGSTTDATSFPLGHMVLTKNDGFTLDRNASHAVYLYTGISYYYTMSAGGAGAQLSGTWRARGRWDDGHLMQRVS